MSVEKLLERFHAAASDPAGLKDKYLAEGKKVVLTAPVYTPEEIVHSMGLVPMGAWGADVELGGSKRYFPAFICSVVQSIVELGMAGVYEGVSALIVPSLCDSLKVLGENWKYAVPSIPFIPMVYPQNRRHDYALDFTEAGYRRVIADLERVTGETFSEEKLGESIAVYNEHNALMRALAEKLASHAEITAAQRSDIFKSAFFLPKEEHSALVRQLLDALESSESAGGKTPIFVSGILCDAPELLRILDENGFQVAGDDVAAQSRQYRTDCPAEGAPLRRLAEKFSAMDHCSVLYDVDKKRVDKIVSDARAVGARGVLVALTKFCDPEEFDVPLIKKACDRAGLPCVQIEIDRQMRSFEQARTALETFRDLLD